MRLTTLFLTLMIGLITIHTLNSTPPQGVQAFGFIPRILIAQIAALHNSTTQPTLQPLLTNAFDGYYRPSQYTFPQAAGEMPRALDGDYHVYQQLSYNPAPFNLANDTKVVKSIAVGQTNSPFLSAQAASNMLNRTSIVWSKAQNIVALFNLVPSLHNPLRCINFFNDAFPQGDESGRLLTINMTSSSSHHPHPVEYKTLADAIDNVFGFYSPLTQLSYGTEVLNKTTLESINKEAQRIMHMFPASSFDPDAINVPQYYTRNGILVYFKDWAKDSFRLGVDIYNTFFEPIVPPPTTKQGQNFGDQSFSGPLSDHTTDHLSQPMVTLNPEINTAQQFYIRYQLLRQIALAGYRMASLSSRFTIDMYEKDPNSHPGYVSNLYRAFTIVSGLVIIFILYWIYVVIAAKAKVRKQREEQQEQLLTGQ